MSSGSCYDNGGIFKLRIGDAGTAEWSYMLSELASRLVEICKSEDAFCGSNTRGHVLSFPGLDTSFQDGY